MLNRELFEYLIKLADENKDDLISRIKNKNGEYYLKIEYTNNYIKLYLQADKRVGLKGSLNMVDIRQDISHIVIDRRSDNTVGYKKWHYKTPNIVTLHKKSLPRKGLLSFIKVLEIKLAKQRKQENMTNPHNETVIS